MTIKCITNIFIKKKKKNVKEAVKHHSDCILSSYIYLNICLNIILYINYYLNT